MTPRKVLVTGANGYIGSNLVDALLSERDETGNPRYQVRGMVLRGTPEDNLTLAARSPNFEVVYADLLDPASLREATSGIDLIFHLAALVSDWAPKELFLKVIFEGTRNLAQAAVDNGVKRLVYMSSLAIHKKTGHVNADETTPRDERKNYYAVAKHRAEDFLVDLWKAGAIETVIVRPGWVIYGPRDRTAFFEMAKNLERGKFGFVNGGRKLICHVFVKNLVAGMIFLGERPAREVGGEAFIIAEGSHNWREYVGKICELLDIPVPKLNVRYGVIAPFVWLVEKLYKLFRAKHSPVLNMYRISIPRHDIDFHSGKLKKLGFEFPHGFEAGMEETCRWYLEVREGEKTPGERDD
ncbi:MAG: NAD-dependent epimerase/dehydratase family protein [Promethearchaeota archaeon]